MDGPRAVRLDEMDALRKLTDVVFRPGMPEQYPQLFNDDNLDNLTVCFDGPICTSHVGMVQREALIMGCRIRVCCIGAVATHPDYRNQGLASACFDSAVQKAHKDGVDIMIVSGGRGLYTRNGCMHLGRDFQVKCPADSFSQIGDPSVRLKPMTDPELKPGAWSSGFERVNHFYRMEAVRFVRSFDGPQADFQYFLQSGWAMNAPAEILTIHDTSQDNEMGADGWRGAPLGYVVVRKAEPGKASSLVEFAGDRDAILAAVPEIIKEYSLTGLSFQVMGSDTEMQASCKRAGLEMTPTSASGTIKLINFPQLMTRMRPRFTEILGAATANRLRFGQDGDQYIFALGEESLALDRDTATRAVFGDLEGLPQEVVSIDGGLGQALRSILPLPTLWYGINYV